jgi:uncharacterized protein (DUF4213/DUF364 family)
VTSSWLYVGSAAPKDTNGTFLLKRCWLDLRTPVLRVTTRTFSRYNHPEGAAAEGVGAGMAGGEEDGDNQQENGWGIGMKILDDLIMGIDTDSPVKTVCQGPFQTAVWTRGCGLASTPHEPGPHHNEAPVKEAGRLLEQSATALARMACSLSPFEAAIGMATINSLLVIDDGRCTEINAADLLAEKGGGKSIALVGHFPFVHKLQREAENLWVIEKHPPEKNFSESNTEGLISEADVVGITGAAFTNHTIEDLLALCRPQAYVLILGGTTPLSPVLFDYGVDAIAGSRVTDPEMALRCVSQGATFRQIKGVRRLIMKK